MLESRKPHLFRTLLAAATGLALSAPALAAETGFESLTEGFHGEVLEVDGITFSNFGDWFDPPGSGQIAAIDDATLWLTEVDPRMSDYVQGNVLNVNGYSSPGYTFFRVQSMEMTTGQREVGASVSFIYLVSDRGGSWEENEVVLELYLEGEMVASRGAFLDNVLGVSKAGAEYGASTITIEDVEFDDARITTRGPVEEGSFLGGFDNFTLGLGGGGCRADLDGDGELTFFDFLEFQNLFAAGDPKADFDGDGEFTFFDFLAFQNEFSAGCP